MMKLLKWIAVITGILAGIACFIVAKDKKDKENAKMDAWLMDDDNNEPPLASSAQDRLTADILDFAENKENQKEVTLSFGLPDLKQASAFQEMAAQAGCSSDLDSKNLVVDVIYTHEFTPQALAELAQELDTAMEVCHAAYQGYHFSN